MALDLISTGSVNYSKATVNSIIGGLFGAYAGAQNGLTGKTNSLKNSLNSIKNKISNGKYSLKGGLGALNLVSYQLKNATNILQNKSLQILLFGYLSSNFVGEEILKYLINSIF